MYALKHIPGYSSRDHYAPEVARRAGGPWRTKIQAERNLFRAYEAMSDQHGAAYWPRFDAIRI